MSPSAHSDARFSATQWSVVLAAAKASETGAQKALEELRGKY